MLRHARTPEAYRLPFKSPEGAQFTSRQGMRCRCALFDSVDVQDADICTAPAHVRFGPKADSCSAAK